jgi:hypothetical protein
VRADNGVEPRWFPHGDMRSPQTPPAGYAFLRRETETLLQRYGSAGSDVTSVATKKPPPLAGAFCMQIGAGMLIERMLGAAARG